MLWVMIRKECLNNLLELRFLVCGGLCIFLAVVSVLVLRADLVAKRADYHSNREIYRKEAQEYGNFENLAREGVRVDRPPQNFQVLFYGTEKTLDRTAVVSRDFLPGFEGNSAGNPIALLFPAADMLFIVGVVLSLLAFFISYDSVAGERERGTLKLLMSYPLPRDTLILAKWIGGYLSLALPFLAALGIGALLIGISGEITFTAEDWQAFGISGVVSLVLIAVMFSIGLLISVLARRSSTAIMSLLAIWVLLALVIPNAGPYVAEVITPIPDAGSVERLIAERSKEINDQFRQEWGGGRGGGRGGRRGMRDMSPEQRAQFFQEMQQRREDLRKEVNKATGEIIRDYEQRLRQQVDIARTLTRLSPVASYAYANTDIGETGVRHERNLVNALRVYQRQFSRYILEQQADMEGFGFGNQQDDEEFSIDDMPVFKFRPESLEGRLSARTIDILLLLVFAVLFFMGAFVSFLRTDIT